MSHQIVLEQEAFCLMICECEICIFSYFFSWIFIYTAFIHKTTIVNVANIWVNEFVKSSFVILILFRKTSTQEKRGEDARGKRQLAT